MNVEQNEDRGKRGGSRSDTKTAGAGVRMWWKNGVDLRCTGAKRKGAVDRGRSEGRGDEGKGLVTDK